MATDWTNEKEEQLKALRRDKAKLLRDKNRKHKYSPRRVTQNPMTQKKETTTGKTQ